MRRFIGILVAAAAVGAALIWPGRTLSHVTTTNTVLFDREIVSILNAHCVGCHAPDGLAPPLVTYEDTWLSRGAILTAVLARHMPPWAGVPGFGTFVNENRLTTRETQFLVSWVEGLGPRNDGSVFLNVRDAGEAPAVVQARADSSAWALGPPDLEVGLPEATIAPDEGERIERLVFDLPFASAASIRAIEFRPGDRSVVRAATFRIESTGQWLGSWTPWHGWVELPDDAGFRIPPGAQVRAEIDYGTTRVPVVERGRLGFFFAPDDGDDRAVVADLVLETSGDVPPDTRDVRFQAETEARSDMRILSLLPEFEAGIDSLEVSVRHPDGGTDILLFARDIPVEWPTPYILAEARPVPAGSRIRATAYYSNAADTPRTGGFRLTLSRY